MLEKHIEHAIGSVQRPLSTQQLEHKFADQAQTALPADQVGDIMARCWEIENTADVGELSRAPQPA